MRTNIFLIAVVFFALVSCDKRKDFYGENNAPVSGVLQLLNTHSGYSSTWINNRSVIDTLKLNSTYKFSINISDENTLVKGTFEGNGSITLNGASFSSGEVENGVNTFEWSSMQLGINTFSVVFEDSYGVQTVYDFKIIIFENILPSTSWVLEPVGNLDPLEKRIVVSGYDGDMIYGGNILYYQYIINGDTTNYPNNVFYYIFPSAGNYSIGVRAMDNNNEWGNEITINNYPIN